MNQPTEQQDERSERRRRVWAAVATVCCVWLLGAAVESVLLVLVKTTSLRDGRLTPFERVSLLAFDLRAWLILTAIVGLPAVLVWRAPPKLQKPRWVRRALPALRVVAIWLALLVYAGGWTAFWAAGSYLDREAVSFWLTQPLQMFHWINGVFLYMVPLLTLAAGVGIDWGLRRLIGRMSVRGHRRLVVATVPLMLASAVLAFNPTRGRERQAVMPGDELLGNITTTGERYNEARRYRSGPFAHALLDLAGWLTDDSSGGAPQIDPKIEIVLRPIIPVSEYLAGVDRSRFKPRNVVMITVESLRADALRAYGSTRDVMPASDALARESIVFQKARAQATHSNYAAPCPLSSQYPLRSGETHVYPPNPTYPRVMIYDVLKAMGYRTGMFSSSNENWGGQINFLDTGNLDRIQHAGNWHGATYVAQQDTGFARWVARTRHAGSVDDRTTVQEAINWIDEEPRGSRPFFVCLNFQNTHFPYVVPADFKRPFGPQTVDFVMAFNNFPRDKIPVVKDLYADSCRYVDDQIGRLIEHLKSSGRWDETILVLTGDHGQAFFEHGFAAHANMLYEELVRVPLVVHAPGEATRLEAYPAQHLDVPPTILHLLGLPPHPGHQGIDVLSPDRPDAAKRSVYVMVQSPLAEQYGIIRGGYKLLYDKRLDGFAFFDLASDPAELRPLDLAGPMAQLAEDAAARLQTWRAAQLDYYRSSLHHKARYAPVLRD